MKNHYFLIIFLFLACNSKKVNIEQMTKEFERNLRSDVFNELLSNKILDSLRINLPFKKTITLTEFDNRVINYLWNQDSSIVIITTSFKHPEGFQNETVLNIKDTLLFVNRFSALTENQDQNNYELVETFECISSSSEILKLVRYQLPAKLADTTEFKKKKLGTFESNYTSEFKSELKHWKSFNNYLKPKLAITLDQLQEKVGLMLENEDTIGAIELLTQFNRANPDNTETQVALVVLKLTAKQIDVNQARKQLNQLQFIDTTNISLRKLYAYTLLDSLDDEGDVAEIDRLIQLDPFDSRLYLEKGRSLTALKKYDEAILAFNKAIELEPLTRYAYADRALAKYLKGDKVGACNDWKTPGGGAIGYYEKYCE